MQQQQQTVKLSAWWSDLYDSFLDTQIIMTTYVDLHTIKIYIHVSKCCVKTPPTPSAVYVQR